MTRKVMTDWMLSMIPENMDFLEQSGASYGADIRRLEAILRPLWGVLPIICGKEAMVKSEEYKKAAMCFQRFRDLVQQEELPKITRATRQIVVETGALSYGLGIFKNRFLGLFTPGEQEYLLAWLKTLNQVELPENNWLFFRVLMNMAMKVNGMDWQQERLESDLRKIHSWYLGDGWYSDGDTRQKDYYVAFGFHYYGMLYARMEQDDHAKLFIERARLFARDFVTWFDPQGRSLPFGRSLTYRFAHVCFWSNFLLSGAFHGTRFTMEICKGLIVRNMAFWRNQPIFQPSAGNLSIGYGYANLLLSEDYNGPGSPFWSFKTFCLLEFTESHPFWNISESAYPRKNGWIRQPLGGFLGMVSKEGRHHVFLSSEQYGANPYLYHGQEKYGKFAYSTYFGFNLTRDIRHIRQFAVDNALALSPKGYSQYISREKIDASRMYERYCVSFWKTAFASVRTYLIPLDNDTHVRIHEVRCDRKLETFEGGFPLFDWNEKTQKACLTEQGAVMENDAGLSRMEDLMGNRTPQAVPQGPNTNIYSCERNGVPALYGVLGVGEHVLASMVRGVPKDGEREGEERKEDLAVLSL